jgi:hypothetical protein
MREGTTSRMTAAGKSYGKFCEFYSVSPENFGSTIVFPLSPIVMQLFRGFVTGSNVSGWGHVAEGSTPHSLLPLCYYDQWSFVFR